MADNPSLLVVDDEEVVCQACKRIFSRQGFQVEFNKDSRQGLALATEKDYAIILLDIKMPNMDGIQFLEQLRRVKPNVPVLIITGYPSIPNAAAAMRLGACDYVTKPFTPEEVTQAVQRVLATRSVPDDAAEEPAAGAPADPLFWDEAWFRLEADGSACVGAVLPGLRRQPVTGVRLPRIGEVVHQGLPLAGVEVTDHPTVIVPAPVSGVVMAVNEMLPRRPEHLVSDPCGEGWIASICTTQYDDEAAECRHRSIVLVNTDPLAADQQAQKLQALGCRMQVHAESGAVIEALRETDGGVAFLDTASLGDSGPDLAALINARAPSVRIVVLASPGSRWEAAYRKHKIFYYSIEPFSDNEIADILTAVFHPQEPPRPSERQKPSSEPISSITITNRNGHKVQLLAAPGLLWRNEGLGCQVSQRLLGKMFPVVIAPGVANLTPANILKTAMVHDRLMVLMARDSGALPGTLAQDAKPDFGVDPGDAAGKVTTLSVQPDAMGGFAGLDRRTVKALSHHIVREMSLY